MDNRPDLPQLESVETRSYGSFFCPAVFFVGALPIAVLIILLHLKHGSPLYDQPIKTMASYVIVFSSFIGATLSIFVTDYYWRVDADGLAVRSLLKPRHIKWSELESAVTYTNWVGETIYKLKTNKGILSIPALIPANGWQESIIIASIWQHLRRYDKAEGIELTGNALSLWDKIPDECPTQIEWINPHPNAWKTHLILTLTFLAWLGLVGMPAILEDSRKGNYVISGFFFAFMGVIIILSIVTELRPCIMIPKRITLSDGNLAADFTRHSVCMPLSEIIRARWYTHNTKRIVLYGKGKGIVIPLNRKDDQSGMLILAIIRQLREANGLMAIIIPPKLRSVMRSILIEIAERAKVELHSTTAERVIISVLFIALAIMPFMIITNGKASAYQIISIMAVAMLLGWFAAGSYALRIDTDGISKRFLWWCKFVSWDKVAGHTTSEIYPRASIPGSILKDAAGKTLIDASAGIGSMRDREAFRSALYARLAQILPPEQLDKPWKSKPWRPGQ